MNGKELLDFARQNEGIDVRIAREGNLNLINYLHLGVDWNDERYRNIRGIVIDDDGEIIQYGYEKFFNHNELVEREDMLPETKELSEWQENESFYVTEKIDGSYIKMSMHNNKVLITSSGSFTGEHVVDVREYLSRHMRTMNDGLSWYFKLLLNKFTLLFEYVSPKYNLTIPYEKENLILHNIIETSNGLDSFTREEIKELADLFGFDATKVIDVSSKEELINMQRTVENFEGWVVVFENGNRLKFKTDWFFDAHARTSMFFGGARTKRNIKSIYEMYITNELDDFISMCTKKSKTDLIDLSVEVIDSVRDFDKNIKSIRNTLKENSISDENRIKILDIFNDKYLVHLAFLVMDDRYLSKEKEKFVLNKVKEEEIRNDRRK